VALRAAVGFPGLPDTAVDGDRPLSAAAVFRDARSHSFDTSVKAPAGWFARQNGVVSKAAFRHLIECFRECPEESGIFLK